MSDDQVYVLGIPVGGTAPQPRKLMFMHIGGPYDGVQMPVEVDADDVPVEMNTILDFSMPDTAIPSFAAVQSKRITNMYARDETADGYVFRFFGGNETNVNRNRYEAA